jgi:hypothetical protein
MKKVRQKTPTDDDIKTHVPGMSQLINTRDDCVETSHQGAFMFMKSSYYLRSLTS